MIRSLAVAGLTVLLVGCTGTIQDPSGSGRGPSGSSMSGGSSMPTGASGGTAQCKSFVPLPARVWRLTHNQFRNTIKETFGFTVPVLDTLPAESRLDGFANAAERLTLSPVLLAYYDRGADAVADQVVQQSADFIKCPTTMLGQGTCLGDFLRGFGQRAWRRPLTDTELGKLTALYQGAAQTISPDEGLKTVVKALVLSANFLFRTELGDGKPMTTLTDYELASALSYTLWDGPPDAALMELAAAGKLHEPATLKGQAQRLFTTSDKARAAMGSFIQQWLETEGLTVEPKDMTTFPIFNAQVARDLEQETRRFVDGIVFDSGGDRSLKTLLTASYGYLDAGTAKIYGSTVGGTELIKTDLDPTQRKGLLTQAGFLAAHAEPTNTSVVGRGRFIREQVLCGPVPPPPGAFKFDDKVITDDMTAREKFTVHAQNPACSSCHALFDIIGFALENYDAIGQYRTQDKGKTIDPSGSLALPSGATIHFDNFIDLIDQMAKGPDAYDCFASQYLQYLSGQVQLDDCARQEIARVFRAADYRVDQLALEIVTSPRFLTRRN